MVTYFDSIGSLLLEFLLDAVFQNSELNKPEFDLDNVSNADEYFDYVYDNGYLDVEVIYYSEAMDYLRVNDSSLRESLGIAHELGYQPKNLNSEMLASMLKTQHQKDAFEELRSKIEDAFEKIENFDNPVYVIIQETGKKVTHHFISLYSDEQISFESGKECTEDIPPTVWVPSARQLRTAVNDTEVIFESHSENNTRHTFVFNYDDMQYLLQIINNEITWSENEQ